MRFSQAWTITRKDFSVFRRKSSLLASLVALPLGIGVGLPIIASLVMARRGTKFVAFLPVVDAFLFFFVIGTVAMASGLAAYSIVGEKTERSLEPLLATPTTDGEILLGKTLAAFLPTIGATWIGVTLFAVLIDAISRPQLGYLYFPNETMLELLFLVAPLTCLCAVELDVLVSSRVSDVRTAQQVGTLLVIPFGGLYALGETNVLPITSTNLLIIGGVLALADVALFFTSRRVFAREEILTRWK